jgi:hypothetical protein
MEAKSGGVGFAGLLMLLFIGLKLTGVIAWSWWWVLSPLWIGLALVLLILLAGAIVVGCIALADKLASKKGRK